MSNEKFVYTAEDGKTGWALKREYAEVAAKAISGISYPTILELSGTPVSYEFLSEALKSATSKNFETIKADDQEFVENLVKGGLPQTIAEMFLSFQNDIKNNQLNVVSNDFKKALGKPLTSLEDGLKELLS